MSASIQVKVNLSSREEVDDLVNTHDVLSISEVAERSGFAASTLRYYETQGLITAQRSPGGRRCYERGVLRRLAFIRAASNVGLTLEEIRNELGRLPSGRTPTRSDWQRISRHWRARLDEQMRALQRLRDGLDSCIGCGCLSLQRCSISNPGDVAAATDDSPGAAYLPAALRRPHRVH
jgi:MerR family redox-sensitive transcriptional activator SoxR